MNGLANNDLTHMLQPIKIEVLMYADDIVLMVDSEKELIDMSVSFCKIKDMFDWSSAAANKIN